jgi:hypothetical protein
LALNRSARLRADLVFCGFVRLRRTRQFQGAENRRHHDLVSHLDALLLSTLAKAKEKAQQCFTSV